MWRGVSMREQWSNCRQGTPQPSVNSISFTCYVQVLPHKKAAKNTFLCLNKEFRSMHLFTRYKNQSQSLKLSTGGIGRAWFDHVMGTWVTQPRSVFMDYSVTEWWIKDRTGLHAFLPFPPPLPQRYPDLFPRCAFVWRGLKCMLLWFCR